MNSRLAFIKDNKVVFVLNTDKSLSDIILNSDVKMDISEFSNLISEGWTFDGKTFFQEIKAAE